MQKIDLDSKRKLITETASKYFHLITALPRSVRTDEKERTGVQVLVIEPGTRNLVMVSVKNPSEAARFFAVEKAVRSEALGDASSLNSADGEKMRFAGSVTVYINEMKVQASVSGLKAEEDVVIAIRILAAIFDIMPKAIISNIKKNGGKLPSEFAVKNHYSRNMLDLKN